MKRGRRPLRLLRLVDTTKQGSRTYLTRIPVGRADPRGNVSHGEAPCSRRLGSSQGRTRSPTRPSSNGPAGSGRRTVRRSLMSLTLMTLGRRTFSTSFGSFGEPAGCQNAFLKHAVNFGYFGRRSDLEALENLR